MKTLKIIAAMGLLGLANITGFAQTSAQATDTSTAALVEVCKNANDQDAQNFCFGFGEGVYQAHMADIAPNAKRSICFANTQDTRDMVLKEFLKWSQANPQFNQEPAAKALIRFFRQRYACK